MLPQLAISEHFTVNLHKSLIGALSFNFARNCQLKQHTVSRSLFFIGIINYTHTDTFLSSPFSRCSFLLISAFIGSKYVFIFVSNQIAVCHSLSPIFAITFNRPQPSSCHLRFALISFAKFLGKEIKCQPACPVYFQILK